MKSYIFKDITKVLYKTKKKEELFANIISDFMEMLL